MTDKTEQDVTLDELLAQCDEQIQELMYYNLNGETYENPLDVDFLLSVIAAYKMNLLRRKND